jgi:hypothetical protein
VRRMAPVDSTTRVDCSCLLYRGPSCLPRASLSTSIQEESIPRSVVPVPSGLVTIHRKKSLQLYSISPQQRSKDKRKGRGRRAKTPQKAK